MRGNLARHRGRRPPRAMRKSPCRRDLQNAQAKTCDRRLFGRTLSEQNVARDPNKRRILVCHEARSEQHQRSEQGAGASETGDPCDRGSFGRDLREAPSDAAGETRALDIQALRPCPARGKRDKRRRIHEPHAPLRDHRHPSQRFAHRALQRSRRHGELAPGDPGPWRGLHPALCRRWLVDPPRVPNLGRASRREPAGGRPSVPLHPPLPRACHRDLLDRGAHAPHR